MYRVVSYMVEHLAVNLEHRSNLAGDEELHAGNGKEVVNLVVPTPTVILILLPIFGERLIINSFHEVFL